MEDVDLVVSDVVVNLQGCQYGLGTSRLLTLDKDEGRRNKHGSQTME